MKGNSISKMQLQILLNNDGRRKADGRIPLSRVNTLIEGDPILGVLYRLVADFERMYHGSPGKGTRKTIQLDLLSMIPRQTRI